MNSYRKAFAQAVDAAMAGATVLTENTRSARAILEAADQRWRATSGAWPTPDVLPCAAFLERLYQQAVVSGATSLHLLGREQELHLWRQLAGRSGKGREILLPECAAELASSAFRTACEYAIPLDSPQMSATSESREFAGWAAGFRRRLVSEGRSCAALLEREVLGLLPRLRLPERVFVYLAARIPASHELLSALREAGCSVQLAFPSERGAGALEDVPAEAVRHEFGSEAEELRGAAHWARQQVESAPGSRVGVIFFDLAGRVAQAESAFSSVLEPERLLGEAGAPLFEIALPGKLGDYPMVRCALGMLALLAGPVDFHLFDVTLRSPYLAAQPEAVARFLWRVRAKARRQVRPEEFATWLREAAQADGEMALLATALERLPTHAPFSSRQPVEHWAEFARGALDAFGWPSGVPLNSEEFQCLESWGEVFDSVSSLEALGWQTDFAGFVERLKRAAEARNFKPETLGAPVQVMDVSEAEGSQFDALWIGGCGDEQWPTLPALSPLIPSGMQKAVGVPAAGTAQGEAQIRRITARLLASAPRIALSLARRCDDEREQRWSPLFAHLPQAAEPIVCDPPLAARFTAVALHVLDDAVAPALTAGEEIHGGTSLLEEQSGCPFRAFAIRRLHARRAEGPQEALEASLRGKIVERAMELIWRELGDSDGLRRGDLAQVIERNVKEAMGELVGESKEPWGRRLYELERQRNIDVLTDWLRVEKTRRPFRVLAHQQPVDVELAGLHLRGKLDRLDQIGSEQVVIDYKTGRNLGPGSWSVPRPLRPQLPFYAVAMRREEHDLAGVAFATIRRDEQQFRGYLRDKDMLPIGADPAKRHFDGMAFDEYGPRWEEELERLAGSFVAGEAAVDPKLPPGYQNSPCQRCHLQALCRVGDGSEGEENDEVEDGNA